MSFLAQPEVLPSLVVLAVWAFVWSRGYLRRARQPRWLAADGLLLSSALVSNLALIASGEGVFRLLLIVLLALVGVSLGTRLVVAFRSATAV